MKWAGVLWLVALTAASACGTTPGIPTPAERTTAGTDRTVPEIPPIEKPRTVVPFLLKPCDVLDDADIEAFGLEAGRRSSQPEGESATCAIGDNSKDRSVLINLVNKEMLRYTYDTKADPSEFELIDVGGHPATRSTVGPGCQIVVAVADEQGLRVVFKPGWREPDDATCATAIDVAGSILERLPLA